MIFLLFSKWNKTVSWVFLSSFNPTGPRGRRGGKCPRWFQPSRTSLLFKQYPQNFATFTEIYWKTRYQGKILVRSIIRCHGNQIFDTMFSEILTFLIFFFLLINNFFKTNGMLIFCLEVKKSIFSHNWLTLHVICDVIGIAQHLFWNPRWRPSTLSCVKMKIFF